MTIWAKYIEKSKSNKDTQLVQTMNVWTEQQDASLIQVAKIIRMMYSHWDMEIDFDESISRAKSLNKDLT